MDVELSYITGVCVCVYVCVCVCVCVCMCGWVCVGVGVPIHVGVRATYLPQADNREPMKVVQVLTVLLAAPLLIEISTEKWHKVHCVCLAEVRVCQFQTHTDTTV